MPNRLLKCLLVATVLLPLAIPHAASAATTPKPTRVVFFGDSITYESGVAIASLVKMHPNWRYKFESYPGIAVCQMHKSLRTDLAKFHQQIGRRMRCTTQASRSS